MAETEHFERQEKELLQEFAKQKEKQITRDSRAYKLFCIAAIVVYLLGYTKYNMYNGGVFGLYSWVTSTLRYVFKIVIEVIFTCCTDLFNKINDHVI